MNGHFTENKKTRHGKDMKLGRKELEKGDRTQRMKIFVYIMKLSSK